MTPNGGKSLKRLISIQKTTHPYCGVSGFLLLNIRYLIRHSYKPLGK